MSKAPASMVVTESGMVIDVKDVQPLNAEDLMVLTKLDIS